MLGSSNLRFEGNIYRTDHQWPGVIQMYVERTWALKEATIIIIIIMINEAVIME